MSSTRKVNNDLELRLLTTGDMEGYISELMKLNIDVLQKTTELNFLYQEIRETFNKIVINERTMIVGAFLRSKLVGCVEVEESDDVSNDCAEISIEVNEEYRRMGIGEALLNKTIEACRNVNYARLKLIVDEDNIAAINLYHSCGFVETARIENTSKMSTNMNVGLLLMERML